MADPTDFIGGSVGLGSDNGVGDTTSTVLDGSWPADPDGPAPGDMIVVVFEGFHAINGTFTRDDPGTDVGWVSFDSEAGWTRICDEWIPFRRSPLSDETDQRFIVWARPYTAAGQEEFDFEVSTGYIGSFRSWRLRGLVFRPANIFTSAPVTGTRSGSVASWTVPAITTSTDALAVTIWTGNATLSVDEGFTTVTMTAIGSMAYKYVTAGPVTVPTVGLAEGHLGVSFALERRAGRRGLGLIRG